MRIFTVNFLRVVVCEHDAVQRAQRNEGYMKGHGSRKTMNASLYNNKLRINFQIELNTKKNLRQ